MQKNPLRQLADDMRLFAPQGHPGMRASQFHMTSREFVALHVLLDEMFPPRPEPNPGEVMRLLKLFNKKLVLRLRGSKRKDLLLSTIDQGLTIAPDAKEYEIVVNGTIFIGWEDGQYVVYSFQPYPYRYDEPPDGEIVEHGRFESSREAARAAVLTWTQVLVDGVLDGDDERKQEAELVEAERLAEKLKAKEKDEYDY